MPATASIDEFLPATQTELSRWVAENASGPARPVYPAGGRTSLTFGNHIEQPGMTLCTTGLSKVIDYPARDMTVTVEAGIRIDELARVLQSERQRLPIDVPQAHRATLGGVAASNASGSRRFGLGTMRDYVIGISAVDASGRLFKAGGRVVKNVAGYDLCKMLIGSLGTLAVITQLTLKLRPNPESSVILWTTFDRPDQIESVLGRLTTSAARPVALDVLDPRAAAAIAAEAGLELSSHRPVLAVGVEGTNQETAWQIDQLRSEMAPCGPHESLTVADPDATKLWFSLAEFQVPSDDPLTFKANLLPSRTVEFMNEAERHGCAVQAHAGSGIVIGHLPDELTEPRQAAEVLASLRELARKCRGNVIVVHCDESWKTTLPVFGDPEPAWPLMRKLKHELDPRNLLNPHQTFERRLIKSS
ncbi:MAG TPA: FAD-binding oxidoreductase [Planctomycetaceae bacterium]|nr:FAD-binding oxidoreductase [Planctomycetaceae bacterium]